jgi:sRNA-binding protein
VSSTPASPNPSSAAEAGAVIELLAELYPACFAVLEFRRKPLAIGIYTNLENALAGAVAPRELANALRRYTSNTGYLRHLLCGAWRFDLAGNPAGTVTKAEEVSAKARLAAMADRAQQRKEAERSARLQVSLASLREVGRHRRALPATGVQ